MLHPHLRCTAFAGDSRIASGELRHVALKAKQAFDAGQAVLVFDDASGHVLALPLALSAGDLSRQLASPPAAAEAAAPVPARGPGRPKLGVVAREVTLLPAHWDWLAAQPGGASVALRRLVDGGRFVAGDGDRRRVAQEAAYRFMQAMARNQPGLDAAARALFAGDIARFEEHTAHWPDDVREHAALLAADALHA